MTESYYERHSLLAISDYAEFYNHDLDKERAKFFVKLLKPNFNTKMEDFFHFFKTTSRASGLECPDRLLLANLRAGNLSTARKENKKLIKKGSKFADWQKKKEEKGKDSRYGQRLQNFYLQRALIEAQTERNKKPESF